MKTLKEILDIYDNPLKKGFSYMDIQADINKLPETIRQQKETKSEYLAFSFQDNTGYKHWKTYLGPFMTGKNKENDEDVYSPDYRSITTDDIEWWEKRASETNNPLLLMRYCGLIFDFKQKIIGKSPDFKSIIQPYAYSIVDAIEGEYFKHVTDGYYYMEHALKMASLIKDEALFERAQQLFWNYDCKYARDEHPGLYGRHFHIMLLYLDKYGKYEPLLVQKHEERFDRLEKNALKDGEQTDTYVHLLTSQCDLLCKYYSKKVQSELIKNHLNRLTNAIRISFPLKGGIWAQSMLLSMQYKYRKYHFYKEANQLYIDIQDMGAAALACMVPQEYSIPINNQQLEEYIEELVSGSAHDVFIKYLVENTPNLQTERRMQQEEAEQAPLLDLIQTTVFDASGNPISNIGVGDDAESQKLMYGMYRRMLLTACFLRLNVIKMEEKDFFSQEFVLEAFKNSPLVVKGQEGIFARGVQAYFEKDYLIACHLLIPLFESAIRRLVAICGGEVLRPNKDPKKGNEYISLDSLLESEEIKNLVGDDVQFYFINLFTDHNGWNLRNRSSHGLLQFSEFNSIVADRIMHAFMLLTQIHFKPILNSK